MRILIVEDDHRIAESIKKGLEQEKMTVDLAYDGDAGYDLAFTETYDCIILDRMLPGIDGLTICKQLRNNTIHTPILMLTAKSQTYDKIDGLNGGADDYLTKPFSFEELLARIRALTRRPKTVQSSTLSFNDITLDTTTYEVSRSGRPVALSQKEYRVLLYFLQHPNIIQELRRIE